MEVEVRPQSSFEDPLKVGRAVKLSAWPGPSARVEWFFGDKPKGFHAQIVGSARSSASFVIPAVSVDGVAFVEVKCKITGESATEVTSHRVFFEGAGADFDEQPDPGPAYDPMDFFGPKPAKHKTQLDRIEAMVKAVHDKYVLGG